MPVHDTLDFRAMTCQPRVLVVELLLDNAVLLPQAVDQSLVVVNKELDILLILLDLMFKTISLNALFVSFAQITIDKKDKPSVVRWLPSPKASWPPLMNASWMLLTLSSESRNPPCCQGSVRATLPLTLLVSWIRHRGFLVRFYCTTSATGRGLTVVLTCYSGRLSDVHVGRVDT